MTTAQFNFAALQATSSPPVLAINGSRNSTDVEHRAPSAATRLIRHGDASHSPHLTGWIGAAILLHFVLTVVTVHISAMALEFGAVDPYNLCWYRGCAMLNMKNDSQAVLLRALTDQGNSYRQHMRPADIIAQNRIEKRDKKRTRLVAILQKLAWRPAKG